MTFLGNARKRNLTHIEDMYSFLKYLMAIFYICIIKLDISTLRVNFHLILKLQACLLETN